jgi:hypothetical protein
MQIKEANAYRTGGVEGMTTELYGINPKSKDGQYFSINVWAWRPLWHIICSYTPMLTEHDRVMGHVNEGYVIQGEKHRAIISTMKEILAKKSRRIEFEAKTQDFGTMPNGLPIAALIPLPGTYFFSWEAMEAYLRFCEANDGYSIR